MAGMAFQELQSSVVQLIRVDHSNVYFQNDKLSEDLRDDLDNIHRKQYRQLMARDSEIQLLRMEYGLSGKTKRSKTAGVKGHKRSRVNGSSQKGKAISFNKRKAENTKDSVLNTNTNKIDRCTEGQSKTRAGNAQKSSNKPSERHSPHTSSSNSSRSSHSSSIVLNDAANASSGENPSHTVSTRSMDERKRPVTVSFSRRSDKQDLNEVVHRVATANKYRNHDRVSSDSSDNENDELDDSPSPPVPQHPKRDRYFDLESDSDDQIDSSDPFGKDTSQKFRKQSLPAFARAKTAIGLGGGRGRKLDVLMDRIRLEKYPAQWYTTVLPASDILVRHKSGLYSPGAPLDPRAKGGRKSKGRRPHTAAATSGNKNQRDLSPVAESEPAEIINRTTSYSRASTRSNRSAFSALSRESRRVNPPPQNHQNSSVFCHQPPSSRTRRQLLEEVSEEQKGILFDPAQLALQKRRQQSQEERNALDSKVKTFVKSLEDLKKSKERNILDSFDKRTVLSWARRENTVI